MDDASRPPELIGAIRPAIAALPESGIVELVNYGREREGLIPLWVGEGDQPTPGFICESAAEALRQGHTFYTYQRGIPPLREALAAYHSALYGRAIGADRMFVTASGMQAIALTVQIVCGPGDEVVVPTPAWPNIVAATTVREAVPRPVPLQLVDGKWRLDLDRLFESCGPRTRALFINSPGNPTGWVMEPEDMVRVLAFARARGLWIIADEVYARIAYGRPHAPSFLEIAEPDDRLIVVNSFSKNWAMTGWRIGWTVAPAALGQVYENVIQYSTSGAPTFQQHAAVAAITEGEPFVRGLVERCRIGRDLVCERLGALPRVRFARPDGAFYLFFAVDGEPDSRALAFRLVDEANVGLAPGTAFGDGAGAYLRLCFATAADRLAEAMDRLAPVLR